MSTAPVARGRAVARRRASFRHAADGIVHAWRTQPNLRIQVAVGAAAAALGVALRLPGRDAAVLALTVVLVLVLEMLNTVVEATVDLASPRVHPLARTAKDVAAGAVLVASAGSVVVGICLFLPRLLAIAAG
jgi:diacylglycerol kinase (ATP)